MRPAILSLGSINADVQTRVDRWPAGSGTMVGRDFALFGGGKAGNVAFLARRLGQPALIIGRVGQDYLGEVALSGVRALGVDLSHVRHIPGEGSGAAMVMVSGEGEKSIFLGENANTAWHEGDESWAIVDNDGPACGDCAMSWLGKALGKALAKLLP